MPWTFRNFVDGRGQNVIKEWLDGLPPKAKAKINARVRALAVIDEWPRLWIKKLHGYDDIFECGSCFSMCSIGPWDSTDQRDTSSRFVIGAIEQGDRITPPDAFTTAVTRCSAVKKGRSLACDHRFE